MNVGGSAFEDQQHAQQPPVGDGTINGIKGKADGRGAWLQKQNAILLAQPGQSNDPTGLEPDGGGDAQTSDGAGAAAGAGQRARQHDAAREAARARAKEAARTNEKCTTPTALVGQRLSIRRMPG